jgi:hypothetical protein
MAAGDDRDAERRRPGRLMTGQRMRQAQEKLG